MSGYKDWYVAKARKIALRKALPVKKKNVWNNPASSIRIRCGGSQIKKLSITVQINHLSNIPIYKVLWKLAESKLA